MSHRGWPPARTQLSGGQNEALMEQAGGDVIWRQRLTDHAGQSMSLKVSLESTLWAIANARWRDGDPLTSDRNDSRPLARPDKARSNSCCCLPLHFRPDQPGQE